MFLNQEKKAVAARGCHAITRTSRAVGLLGGRSNMHWLNEIRGGSDERRILGDMRCSQCGYCLYGVPTNRCPECGTVFDADVLLASHQVDTSKWWLKWSRAMLWFTLFVLYMIVCTQISCAMRAMYSRRASPDIYRLIYIRDVSYLWWVSGVPTIACMLLCGATFMFFREDGEPKRKRWRMLLYGCMCASLCLVVMCVSVLIALND
jgi:hypothetical protein